VSGQRYRRSTADNGGYTQHPGQPAAPELMIVEDVYGDTYRVARADYLAAHFTRLPLYLPSGVKLADHYERMNWGARGLPTTIHRENIAKVQP
jgi:hypothetical protein